MSELTVEVMIFVSVKDACNASLVVQGRVAINCEAITAM